MFRSLSEAISIEKIAAMKAEHMAMKRTTIEETDDVGLGSHLCVMLDFDVVATKDIVCREWQWRTYTAVLQSTGKVTDKSLLYCNIRTKFYLIRLILDHHTS
jgi:hypothetical protein